MRHLLLCTLFACNAEISSTMTANLLTGQHVLVTGAGRGIGRAIARVCYAEGARVAITARSRAELEETASICTSSTLGEKSSGMLILPNCDVTNENDVEAMVKEVVKQFGGLDILINNAGGPQPVKGPLISLKSNDLRNLLDLNVVSVHTVTSTVLRHTSDNWQLKHIINISSRAGKIGIPGMGFYVASKFALEGYAATLAEELRGRGIVVNTLSPGMVDTVSFPKAPGQEGVRTPESVEESLLVLLQQTIDYTGYYLHADELDESRAKGLPDTTALKPINERKFSA